jgi:putative colanic acid biosynthesis UDP-glucose lipid carrier transferase
MIVNRKSIHYLWLFSDLILLNIAFIAAAILAQSFDILVERNRMFILLTGLNFVWYFFTSITNFYDDFATRLFAVHIFNISKNILIQALLSILYIFIIKEDLFTRNFIIYYSVFLFTLITLRSFSFRLIMKKLREKGINIRNILIAGSGEVAENFKRLLNDNPNFGYRFMGFINDKEEDNNEILGSYDQLEDLIGKGKVNEVVIALPGNDTELLNNIIRICNRNAVRVHIIPDYFRFISKRFQVSMIGNFPIITSRNEPLNEIQWRFTKRCFDIIFSLPVLILLIAIILPIIAITTKLISRSSVFFVQERIGARNKKFKCYKFRTLYEESSHADFKPVIENDPRITPVGRFLRKSSIDELPQFYNVLKGDMSIVGPRPHAIPYDDKYGKFVEEIKLRHSIKPGITGWAQIHGLRGDVEDEEENKRRTMKRIEYDLWYIENWSFWLDIQIILQTIWKMLRGKTKAI